MDLHRLKHAGALSIPGDEAVAVKVDVTRLVAQDESAHRRDRLVAHVLPNDSIVARADDFDDEQDEHLELHTESAPTPVEPAEGEGVGDQLATDTLDAARQEPRVFPLLGEPRVHHRTNLGCRCAEFF
jgi:hypothetical protein